MAKKTTRRRPTKSGVKTAQPMASGGGVSPLERMIREALHGDTSQPKVSASEVRGLPAAWYSINKICGHVGSLPLNLYYRPKGRNAELATWHPSYWLVKREPSEITAPSVFRETMHHHALLRGNGRAYIARNQRNDPSELVILQPEKWAIVVELGPVINGVKIPDSKWHVRVDDPRVRISDRDCLHIMGLSDDGISGLGVLDAARHALGLAVEQQVRAWQSERKGVRLKLLLSAPPGAFRDETAANRFLKAFNEHHSDPDKTDQAGLLREGISAETISQTNKDAQAIEARAFSRQDIGLLFQVEQMLGDDSSVSYKSLEEKNKAYLTNCLMRWLSRWEEECGRKLLTRDQFGSEEWYFKFITAALLRGTTKERYEVYQIARQIEVMSANEVRELEDMNAREDGHGDEYVNPAINPNTAQSGASGKSTDNTPATADTSTAARLDKIVRMRIVAMATKERDEIAKAVADGKDLSSWPTEFYGRWSRRVEATIAECDGPEALASKWISDGAACIAEVVAKTESRHLAQAVTAALDAWLTRANRLASEVVSHNWSACNA